MYETFNKLIELNNCSLYKVAKDTKIPYSTLADWKNGKSIPKADKLQKIAEYFGVTVDYLMGNEKNVPVLEIQTASTLAKLSRETRILTYAEKMMELSDEQKELIYKMIDNMK